MIKVICKICLKDFWIRPSYVKKDGNFCSPKCCWQSKKGKSFYSPKGTTRPLAFRKRFSQIAKKRGYGKWMKGKKLSLDHRKNISDAMTGKRITSERWNWKGGKIKTSAGYLQVINPLRFAGDKRQYLREHRIVVEEYIGRPLKRTEEVHHLKEITNNDAKNLIAFINRSAHQRFHKDPQNVLPEEIIFDGRQL